MDVQLGLLSKLVHEGEMSEVVSAKITEEFFTDEQYARIFRYLLDHWRKYGGAADLEVMSAAFPGITWPESPHSLEFFIDEMRKRRKRALFTGILNDTVSTFQTTDPDAMAKVHEMLKEGLLQVALETSPTLDMDLITRRQVLISKLHDRMDDPGFLRGISTGFQGIDYVTGGLQPEQFVVLIGLPKSMKSSTLLRMAMNIHAQGRVPLFLGFEMSNDEQEDRLMSLYGEVGLTRVMAGTLNFNELQRIDKALKLLEGMRSFVLSVDVASETTVSSIQAKIMEYRPDVVLIDGAYLLKSELPKVEQGSASALTDVARSLKMLAQAQAVPIVVTTQASYSRAKTKLSMYSGMYTQAWQQSADLLLGSERVDPDAPDDGDVAIRLSVLASRGGPKAETILLWNWSRGQVNELPRVSSNGDDDD